MYELKVAFILLLIALGIAGPVVGVVHLGIWLAFEWHPGCLIALPWGLLSVIGWAWLYCQGPEYDPFA